MRRWELREFFSLFYIGWINHWIEAPSFAPNNWLKISTDEILNNSRDTFTKICNFIDEFDDSKITEFNKFSDSWPNKQAYLIEEINLVNKIVGSVVSDQEMIAWDPSWLCIWSEAMIQRKLRDSGYNLKCSGLDTFPTNSIQLYELLEKL